MAFFDEVVFTLNGLLSIVLFCGKGCIFFLLIGLKLVSFSGLAWKEGWMDGWNKGFGGWMKGKMGIAR